MPENHKRYIPYRAASLANVLRLKNSGFKSPKHCTRALHLSRVRKSSPTTIATSLLLILMASAAPYTKPWCLFSLRPRGGRALNVRRRKFAVKSSRARRGAHFSGDRQDADWVGGASDKENSEPGASDTKLKTSSREQGKLNGCRFLLRTRAECARRGGGENGGGEQGCQRWEGEASKLRDELASVKDELDKARVATAAAQGFVKRHQEMQRQQQEAAETMRRAEALKLAAESQAAAVEPPGAAAEPSAPAPDGENIGHPPPPPRSPARPTPKAGEDAFPKVDVEKVKLARQVAKQTQEALRAQEAAIAQINQLLVENAKLGKELAEERKKTGALENIVQDIFKGWWG